MSFLARRKMTMTDFRLALEFGSGPADSGWVNKVSSEASPQGQ